MNATVEAKKHSRKVSVDTGFNALNGPASVLLAEKGPHLPVSVFCIASAKRYLKTLH